MAEEDKTEIFQIGRVIIEMPFTLRKLKLLKNMVKVIEDDLKEMNEEKLKEKFK